MNKPVVPKSVPADTAPPDAQPAVRILKSATCPTLSGRSTLTYQIGGDDTSAGLIRLHANTGGGIFNTDWIDLKVIRALLEKHPEDRQVTSHLLSSLYHGKSANSPAFLFAVLVAEGWVKRTGEKPLLYHKGDTGKLFAEVGTLLATEIHVDDVATLTPDSRHNKAGRKKLSKKQP